MTQPVLATGAVGDLALRGSRLPAKFAASGASPVVPSDR